MNNSSQVIIIKKIIRIISDNFEFKQNNDVKVDIMKEIISSISASFIFSILY